MLASSFLDAHVKSVDWHVFDVQTPFLGEALNSWDAACSSGRRSGCNTSGCYVGFWVPSSFLWMLIAQLPAYIVKLDGANTVWPWHRLKSALAAASSRPVPARPPAAAASPHPPPPPLFLEQKCQRHCEKLQSDVTKVAKCLPAGLLTFMWLPELPENSSVNFFSSRKICFTWFASSDPGLGAARSSHEQLRQTVESAN